MIASSKPTRNLTAVVGLSLVLAANAWMALLVSWIWVNIRSDRPVPDLLWMAISGHGAAVLLLVGGLLCVAAIRKKPRFFAVTGTALAAIVAALLVFTWLIA